MQLTKLPALVAIALCIGIPGAFATVLPLTGGTTASAGTNFTGTIGAEVAGDPIVAYLGVTLLPGSATGDLHVGVALDSDGTHLDFLYQYKVTSGDLGDVSVTNFSSWITDVGYATSLAGWDTVSAPLATSVKRGADGSFIDFLYDSGSVNTNAPSETAILVVKTNATSALLTGNTAIQEGGNANRASYAPVPEPSKAGLVLGLLFGASLFAARRFRVLQS